MAAHILIVALGGALGTLARFGVFGLVRHVAPGQFPWATLVANGLGCLFFGLVVGLAEHKQWLQGESRLFLLTGFLGAFTTFSTFAYDTADLVERSGYAIAATNVIAQNALGIALVFLGLFAGKSLGA